MTRRRHGELEAEVLAALWAAPGPLTATQVQTELGNALAPTTISTILVRLVDKGLAVRSQEAGTKAFRYAPAQERAQHAAEQMHAFLDSVDEPRAVLTHFLGRLSPAERRTLRDLLQRR